MGEIFLAVGLLAVAILQAELMFLERKHHHEVVGLLETCQPEVRRNHVAALHEHIDQVVVEIKQAMPEPSTDHAVRQALSSFESSHRTLQEQHINGFPVVDTLLCKCDLCVAARIALG